MDSILHTFFVLFVSFVVFHGNLREVLNKVLSSRDAMFAPERFGRSITELSILSNAPNASSGEEFLGIPLNSCESSYGVYVGAMFL